MKTHEAHERPGAAKNEALERPGAAKKTKQVCNGCKKTFVNAGNLNKHIKDG